MEVGDCVHRSVMFALCLVKRHSGPGSSGKLDCPAEFQRPKLATVNQNPVSQLLQEEKSISTQSDRLGSNVRKHPTLDKLDFCLYPMLINLEILVIKRQKIPPSP